MKLKQNSFHRSFALNGNSFSSVNELLAFARYKVPSIYPFLFDWFTLENITVQTSGSTGKPKAIKLKIAFMVNSALATGKFFDLPKNTTALLCLSPNYIAGKMMLVRALTLGWKLDVVALSSFPLRGIKKQYDFCAMVPMQVQNSLDKLRLINKIIIGGGVVSKELKSKLQKCSTQVFVTYGMTETITHIAVKRLNKTSQVFKTCEVYKTLPDVYIYIDQRNCLVIEAPKISDELIITNDVIQLVSDVQFEWLGRFDNVINSGGVKLHPEKIEEKLSKIIKERFFVAGIFDAILGEKLVLIIESEKQKINLKEIQNLSKYELPKEIYFIKQFIETATKKIQREKTLDLLKFIRCSLSYISIE